MPKIKGLILSKDEVAQEINTSEIAGVDLSTRPDLVERIAQIAIDKMIERTESGKDVFNRNFKGYSKSYKDSLEFKASGKTSFVDLKLSGDMIGSIDVVDRVLDRVTIGLQGTLQNNKAFGHMTGMEGHPTLEGRVPVRNFFGVPVGELKKEVKKELGQEIKLLKEEMQELSAIDIATLRIESRIRQIIDEFEDDT